MHPDLGGDHESAALINEAYAVLMNPTARAEYDRNLAVIQNLREKKAAPSAKQTSKKFQENNHEHCLFCHTKHSLGRAIEPETLCTECSSPLFLAEKQTFQKSCQRAILRIDKQWPVEFYTKWPQSSPHSGHTQDVSLNGMQILAAQSLSEDQVVKITGKFLDSVARVVNQQAQPIGEMKYWRVGLEFITLCFHRTHGTFVSVEI